LGNFAVYGDISFQADGDQNNVVVSAPPVVEFGRVGTDYHDGAIWNMFYGDVSPIQDTDAKVSSVGTFPAFEMTGGSMAFDYIHAANEAITVGYLSVAAGLFVLSANATNLIVDGSMYAGETINVGQHYSLSYDTLGGTFTTLNATAGVQNLEIYS
jgi:hypothetical protein